MFIFQCWLHVPDFRFPRINSLLSIPLFSLDTLKEVSDKPSDLREDHSKALQKGKAVSVILSPSVFSSLSSLPGHLHLATFNPET